MGRQEAKQTIEISQIAAVYNAYLPPTIDVAASISCALERYPLAGMYTTDRQYIHNSLTRTIELPLVAEEITLDHEGDTYHMKLRNVSHVFAELINAQNKRAHITAGETIELFAKIGGGSTLNRGDGRQTRTLADNKSKETTRLFLFATGCFDTVRYPHAARVETLHKTLASVTVQSSQEQDENPQSIPASSTLYTRRNASPSPSRAPQPVGSLFGIPFDVTSQISKPVLSGPRRWRMQREEGHYEGHYYNSWDKTVFTDAQLKDMLAETVPVSQLQSIDDALKSVNELLTPVVSSIVPIIQSAAQTHAHANIRLDARPNKDSAYINTGIGPGIDFADILDQCLGCLPTTGEFYPRCWMMTFTTNWVGYLGVATRDETWQQKAVNNQGKEQWYWPLVPSIGLTHDVIPVAFIVQVDPIKQTMELNIHDKVDVVFSPYRTKRVGYFSSQEAAVHTFSEFIASNKKGMEKFLREGRSIVHIPIDSPNGSYSPNQIEALIQRADTVPDKERTMLLVKLWTQPWTTHLHNMARNFYAGHESDIKQLIRAKSRRGFFAHNAPFSKEHALRQLIGVELAPQLYQLGIHIQDVLVDPILTAPRLAV